MRLALLAALCATPVALAAQDRPPLKVFSAVAYDSLRQVFVIFGGGDTTNGDRPTNETWEGVNRMVIWRQMRPPQSPPARILHELAFDPVRRLVILFGGVTENDTVLGDTWEWNGTTWRQGPSGPPARYLPSLRWNPERSKVVLTGGRTSRARPELDDEWEYDGRWRRVRAARTVLSADTMRPVYPRRDLYMRLMHDELRRLVAAQQSFFGYALRYTTSLDTLRFVPANGVAVRFVTARNRGWSAIATHPALPGARCGVFLGAVPPPFEGVNSDGVPLCGLAAGTQ